jgi:hypothetical protein
VRPGIVGLDFGARSSRKWLTGRKLAGGLTSVRPV